MRKTSWLSGVAAAALGVVVGGGGAFAAAGDECVKILGYLRL